MILDVKVRIVGTRIVVSMNVAIEQSCLVPSIRKCEECATSAQR